MDQNATKDLSAAIRFAAGEIATFKQAVCETLEQMNESSNRMYKTSNKMFWVSLLYFIGSLILSLGIVFAALVQAKIIDFS